MTTKTECDTCGNDQPENGFIRLTDDSTDHHFCSWDCVAEFAAAAKDVQ